MSSVIFTATGNGTGGMIKLLQWHSCTLSPGAYSLLMNSSASPCVYLVSLNFALQVVTGKVQYGTPFALFQEGTGRSCLSVPIILFENEN